MKEQVIKLALEGLSDMKIADKLNIISHRTVQEILNEAREEDVDLAYQIQMARYLNHRALIDKDLLEDIKTLNAQNFSKEEMAILLDQDYDNIVYHIHALAKSSLYKDPEAYQRIKRTQEKLATSKRIQVFQRLEELERLDFELDHIHSSQLDTYRIYKKIKSILQDYQDYNMQIPDEKLAARYDISTSYLREILNGEMYQDLVVALIGEDGLEKIQNYRQQNLGGLSPYHLYEPKEVNEKREKAMKYLNQNVDFWVNLVLTFRLSIDDLAYFLFYPSDCDLSQLRSYIYSNIDISKKQGLDYLFLTVSQKEEDILLRRKKVKAYILKLNAAFKKGQDAYQIVLGEISDAGYRKLVKSGKPVSSFTEEDWRTYFNYHLKYALTTHQSPYSLKMLNSHCPKDLQQEFQQLKNYSKEESEIRFRNAQRGI